MPYKNTSDFAKYQKKYSAEHKKKKAEYHKKWAEKNLNVIRKGHWRRKYGITEEEYNELFNKQSGCCAICGRHQSEFKRALGVDHNHQTGRIRGLLCYDCNTGLGRFKDNIKLLKIAVDYLGEEG